MLPAIINTHKISRGEASRSGTAATNRDREGGKEGERGITSAQVADGFRLLRVHPASRELGTRVCLSCGRRDQTEQQLLAERDGGKRRRRSSVWLGRGPELAAGCRPNWRTWVTNKRTTARISSGPRSKFTERGFAFSMFFFSSLTYR